MCSPSLQTMISCAGTESFVFPPNCSFTASTIHRGLNSDNLPHALFHHGATLDRVGEFVADQHAVFIVLVGCGGVDVAGHARNGTRRNTAFGDPVALVSTICSVP